MLDIGIGHGRTSLVFGPLANTYVGIDYAPRMVAIARFATSDYPHLRLETRDARDLTAFSEAAFDVVLFSFNGLDYVSYTDRHAVLAQIRRVMAPRGLFVFSSHSLGALPFSRSPLTMRGQSLPRVTLGLVRTLVEARRVSVANRNLALDIGLRRGWVVTRDVRSMLKLETCFIAPWRQVADLGEAGFEVEAMYSHDAVQLAPDEAAAQPWVYYWCRPAPATDKRSRSHV